MGYLEVPSPGATDTGADLWVADRDGGRRRRLVSHPQPNYSIRTPTWEDNDHLLVVVDRSATCEGCNPQTTSQQTLERVDVSTGKLTLVRTGVTAFDLSPDRGNIVYPDTSAESAAALFLAAFPDAQGHPIVPTTRGFAEITSMRFSPDGSEIAFAAADGRLAQVGHRFVSSAATDATARLDGLPENLWAINATGQRLRLIATLHEDLPAIAWSPDSTVLFVIGTSALYRINVNGGDPLPIGRGAVHSQLVYLPALPDS